MDLRGLDCVALVVIAKNGLPFGVTLEVIFRDSISNTTLVTAVNDKILFAAEVDENGTVVSPTESKVRLDITSEEMEKVKQANQVIFGIKLNSPQNGSKPASLGADNIFDVSLIVEATANANEIIQDEN